MMLKVVAALAVVGAAVGRGRLEEKTVAAGAADALCDPNVKQMVGYYKLTTGNKNYFYWGFESRSNPATDPVVLWMTGGPGCSSELALLVENGPCHVTKDGTSTFNNPYSWNSNATLIYIDQPTGTGFSYGTGYDTNEKQIAADMFDFLQQFFKAHPQYQKLPFYVFGESYGGHYVPAVTHQIWKENQVPEAGKLPINLKGTSIGNGLTDPAIQYMHYAEMARSTNEHEPAVSEATADAMRAAAPECVYWIEKCQAREPQACTTALDICNLSQMIPFQRSGRNIYDMRIPCEIKGLCYNFTNVETFMNLNSTRAALGVGDRKWSSCSKAVTLFMAGDEMLSYQQLIPDQLAAGIRVQLYAGDQDYICNWIGNKAWAKALEWPGKKDFNTASDVPWTLDNIQVALIRSAMNFSFVQVHSAGHMVPMDQPAVALAMLNNFIHQ